MNGLVVKSTGSSYWVLPDEKSDFVECKIKGTFRTRAIRSTNPVVVGDRVAVEERAGAPGLITEIHDRQNMIVRRASNLSKQSHILAANVDMAALVVTVNHPKTYTVFIDRFLASAESYRIPAILIFNKTDLYSDEEMEQMNQWIQLYRQLDYPCYAVSAEKREGIEDLNMILSQKITLFTGNSGVGKSTLINALTSTSDLRTGVLSKYHNKGMHTTTFSEMISLPDGGFAIDTPGIKGFGLIEMTQEEAGHYFREIFALSPQCRFYNCTHLHEPGCAVLEAVEKETITLSRYQSYLSIIDETTQGKYR